MDSLEKAIEQFQLIAKKMDESKFTYWSTIQKNAIGLLELHQQDDAHFQEQMKEMKGKNKDLINIVAGIGGGMMKIKDLLQRIEEIFSKKLSAKTGWGKNEVLVAYKDSVKEALMESID